MDGRFRQPKNKYGGPALWLHVPGRVTRLPREDSLMRRMKPVWILPVGLSVIAVTITVEPRSYAVKKSISGLLDNVTGAKGFRFDAKDNFGVGLDTIKIIENPTGGYLAVYHHLLSGEFQVRLATSTNLLNWVYKRTLATNASQPTIACHAASGGFYLVYEQWMSPGSTGACYLKINYYPNVNDLLDSAPTVTFVMPHSAFNPSNLEGTPNVYSISPDVNTLEIGFHYYNSTISKDRTARGTLSGFFGGSPVWTSHIETAYNTQLIGKGVNGNLGDRDYGLLDGKEINIQEGQLVQFDFGSWRSYLYYYETADFQLLDVKTPKGSTAFGNPTFTVLTLPGGEMGIVVTYFIFSEGAAPGEAGQLIFYHELPSASAPRWRCYD